MRGETLRTINLHGVAADSGQRETRLYDSPIESFGQEKRNDQSNYGPERSHDDKDDNIGSHGVNVTAVLRVWAYSASVSSCRCYAAYSDIFCPSLMEISSLFHLFDDAKHDLQQIQQGTGPAFNNILHQMLFFCSNQKKSRSCKRNQNWT